MSVQKFIIKKSSSNFTTFLNKILQGLRNYDALGLYTYISSLPNGWIFHKEQLAKHGNIGRDKITKLLKILENHDLVHIVQIRDAQGRFAHFELEVKDGSSFKINDLENLVQPSTEKPLTANQLLVNRSYKEYKNKEHKKEKEYISCASEDAHSNFDEFWKSYPIKKNKVRAKKIWDRKKLNDKSILICEDAKNRLLNDQQWKDKQFIPHPSTYLLNELWNDEITINTTNTTNKPEMKKANTEIRSTIQEWGPGHPGYDSLHGGKHNDQNKSATHSNTRTTTQEVHSTTNGSNARRGDMRSVKDHLLSIKNLSTSLSAPNERINSLEENW